jgi:clan AA aspartic protease (TIGR02281 family)
MLLIRKAVPKVLACGLMLLLSLPTYGEGQSPEDVLTAKKLTKVGNEYLLPFDAGLPRALQVWDAAQAHYRNTNNRRADLEREQKSVRTRLENLARQLADESEKLGRMSRNDVTTYNRQVSVANGIRTQMLETIQAAKDREKTLASLEDPTEEYTSAIQNLSQSMESTAKAYEDLAADKKVSAALEQINQTASPKASLGPSQLLRTQLPTIRRQRDQIVPATIRFVIYGGVPHVPVMINDSVKCAMVVDSGAANVLLTSQTAREIGLRPADIVRTETVVTADGTTLQAKVYKLASIKLGAFVVNDVEAGVLPPGTKGDMNLLGGSFLRHFVYKMDLAAGELRLTQIPDSQLAAQNDVAEQVRGADANARPGNEQIVSARYGADKQWADVTDTFTQLVRSRRQFLVSSKLLGADPAPTAQKSIEVVYIKSGGRNILRLREGETVYPSEFAP